MEIKLNLVENGIFPIVKDINGKSIPNDTDWDFSGTFQGEGKWAGIPCIFIRTSGCNLRCWVLRPGRVIPYVNIKYKGRKKITDVEIGDEIVCFNELENKLDYTKVTELIKNDNETEIYEITAEGTSTFYLTKDHPLLTNKGWVLSQNLNIDDELLHFKFNDLLSMKMSGSNNPIFKDSIKDKIYNNENYINSRKDSGVKSAIVRKEKGITWKSYLTNDEIEALNKAQSERMKLNNPMFNLETRKKSIESHYNKQKDNGKYKKSKLEIKFEKLLKVWGFEKDVWFTGVGGYMISNKHQKKVRVPDFKEHGKKKIIEITQPFFRRPDFEKYKKETEIFYNECGYECLVINMDWGLDIIKEKVVKFLLNGIKITKIKKYKDLQYYKESKLKTRVYKSINLHCEPHNNYLVKCGKGDWFVSHNCGFKDSICDTPYSSFVPEKNITTIDDILKILDINNPDMRIKHIVISGGEPTMQAEAIIQLSKILRRKGYKITIETNATIYHKEFIDCIDMVSMSPKLKSSVPSSKVLVDNNLNIKWQDRHEKLRKKLDVIGNFLQDWGESVEGSREVQLKFVVSTEEDVKEIVEEWLEPLRTTYHFLKNEDVLLMPEGVTEEQLKVNNKIVAKLATQYGFRFCPRLHVDIFGGAKKGV